MLSYCNRRITDIGNYAKKVAQRLNASTEMTDINVLLKLSDLCSRSLVPSPEREELVDLAFRIQDDDLVKRLCKYRLGLKGRKLGLMIRSLARSREAFKAFERFRNCIRESSTFSFVTTPLPTIAKRNWKLDDILKDLDMLLGKATGRHFILKRESMDHLRCNFERAKARLRVHAEVQVVLHAMKAGIEKFVPYIGSGRLSCFLCSKFLHHLPGNFKTCGSHGKLYCYWTIPRTPDLRLKTVSGIEHSIRLACAEFILLLKNDLKAAMPIQRQCSNCPGRVFTDAQALKQHCLATGHSRAGEAPVQPRCLDCPRRIFIDAQAVIQHCSDTGHRSAGAGT